MERVAREAISSTNQRLADDIKAKRTDGKLEPEKMKRAMKMSLDYFVGHIKRGALAILQAAWGPVQAWLADYLRFHGSWAIL